MANKLSWDPPKWQYYTLNEGKFEVKLETGEIFTGTLSIDYIRMDPDHQRNCYKIFGQCFSSRSSDELKKLSEVLDLSLIHGNWPEYHDVREFLKRYYERVAKIGNSNISKICIETEFDITPKFTI